MKPANLLSLAALFLFCLSLKFIHIDRIGYFDFSEMLALHEATSLEDILQNSTESRDQCLPNILLIGDSVDRLIVTSMCDSENNQTVDWSEGVFRTRRYDSLLCRLSRGNIAHLHVYGSNATGPYYTLNSTDDLYLGTKARIQKGLEIFTQKLGPPTMIVFQIVAWDLSRLMADRALSDPTKQTQYHENMIARVREVLHLKGNATSLLLRTAPASKFANGLMRNYNSILRGISSEMGVGLVDFDQMLWGPGNRTVALKELFKDNVHPHSHFLRRFGEHLMRRAQSACRQPPGSLEADRAWPSLRHDPGPANASAAPPHGLNRTDSDSTLSSGRRPPPESRPARRGPGAHSPGGFKGNGKSTAPSLS